LNGPSTGLRKTEKLKMVLLYGVIAAATLGGLAASFAIGRVALVLAGLAVVAYIFGLRHGVDADHIAAIDNMTRKLLQEGKRPLAVGAWFSLGHSTVVVGLIVALVLATRTIATSIPALSNAGAFVGTLVSGSFLWIVGLINVVIVLSIYKVFQALRRRGLDEAQLEELLEKRGFMNRFFGPLMTVVKKPWQVYPVGVLFGLGFDTASEVALIAISVGVGVSTSIPVYYVLVLPLMFTCGMVLVDTTDGVLMRVAYGWAFLNPLRKVYYNLTVTLISVLVAWAVGTVELLQVVSGELSLSGGFWNWLNAIDFESLGYAIVAIFVVTWVASLAYWKYKKFEQHYAGTPPTLR
jgi:nickel/cobalt transporter (NiCoT) family protein